MKEESLHIIEGFGDKYIEKYLKYWGGIDLENNWWKALEFFFWHSFMRGRRDTLSSRYCCFAIEALKDYLRIGGNNLEKSYRLLSRQADKYDIAPILSFKKTHRIGKGNSVSKKWIGSFTKEIGDKNEIVKLLITDRKVPFRLPWRPEQTEPYTIHLTNDADLLMVLDILRMISENSRKNVYNYIKGKVVKGEARKVYEELTGIRGVSDKIATFMIRDVGLLNPGIMNTDYELAFPVDRWVRKIANKLGFAGNDKAIKKFFIERSTNPLKLAAGIWFLGTHAVDMMLEIIADNMNMN